MFRIAITDGDRAQIDELITDLMSRYDSVEDPEFLKKASLYAQSLPLNMREKLLEFKLHEAEPVCLISGFKVDDADIGPTPAHWMEPNAALSSKRENFYLILCCHVLGEAVAWATEQGGNLVHEVLPIAGNDGGQLGTSTDSLEWHTEDAFHPDRMDYVALLCLRNEDGVATTFASIDDLKLDDATKAALGRPAFPFQPDEGNRADRELSSDDTGLVAELITRSHVMVEKMYSDPERVPALFGGPSLPYLRVHPYYIASFGDDQEAETAFEALKTAVNNALREVVLTPGELMIIDNYTSVHGRRKIPGRYDGSDRWLKRAFIVRDLRKTRHLRVSAEARVVY